LTTPAAPVTVSTDKTAYNVGDPITVTVEYADPANPGSTLTVTATVTNADGSTATGTVDVNVGGAPAQPLQVAVTDSFGGSYTQQSNDPGTAVFTGTVSAVPAGA
jgi:flagellar basal body L-ring protein FlgH